LNRRKQRSQRRYYLIGTVDEMVVRRGVQAVKIKNPSEICAISLFKIPLRGLQLLTVYRVS
jgi:hypothetical protein